MEIRGDQVLLRPLREDDVAALLVIAAEPSVSRWWSTFDGDDVRSKAAGDELT